MTSNHAHSIPNDRPEQPPAWVLDVLTDLQKAADKRGMVRLSAELHQMRTQLHPER